MQQQDDVQQQITNTLLAQVAQNRGRQETLCKRRKLSDVSQPNSSSGASEAIYSSSDGQLRNSFSYMHLNDQRSASQDFIHIPQPIKPQAAGNMQSKLNLQTALQEILQKKDQINYYEDFIKHSQQQQAAQQSVQAQQQHTQKQIQQQQDAFTVTDSQSAAFRLIQQQLTAKAAIKGSSVNNFTPFFLPFGVPVDLNEIFGVKNLETSNNLATSRSVAQQMMIGPLTRAERHECVQRYLEKKKNRNFRTIRYKTRKDLADNRERVHGRFVKNAQPRFKFDIYDKQLIKSIEKGVEKIKIQENSSWPGYTPEAREEQLRAELKQSDNTVKMEHLPNVAPAQQQTLQQQGLREQGISFPQRLAFSMFQ